MFPLSPFIKKIFTALIAVLLLYLIIWLGTLIYNNVLQTQNVGFAPRERNTITVFGEGRVTAQPNIAFTDIGLITEHASIGAAQKENTEKMNALIAAVKGKGIADVDIQTTLYQISPKYVYKDGRSFIEGYTVAQRVRVKIRDLAKISGILASVGEHKANEVSGVQFTVDDPANLRSVARKKAVAAAQKTAAELGAALGVRVVRLVSFSENFPIESGRPVRAMALDVGGVEEPQIETGSLDIVSEVTMQFEVQ